MPTYSVRVLRPDDTSAHIEERDFDTDADAYEYARTHWGAKPREIWLGDKRLARLVSARHEMRTKQRLGRYVETVKTISPYISQYAYSCLPNVAALPAVEQWKLITAAETIYEHLQRSLSGHAVWLRGELDPAAPASTPQVVRFGISPVTDAPDGFWRGGAMILFHSLVSEGNAIRDDLYGLIDKAFSEDLELTSASLSLKLDDPLGPNLSEIGGFYSMAKCFGWKITGPPKSAPWCP